METTKRFKVVNRKGKRIAGPFVTYADAIDFLKAVRDIGMIADVKAVGK